MLQFDGRGNRPSTNLKVPFLVCSTPPLQSNDSWLPLAPNFHIPSQLAAKFTPKYLVLFSTLGALKTENAKSLVAFRISWSTTRVGANPIVWQSQAAAATAAAHPSLVHLFLAACTSDSTANSFNGLSVSHQDTKNPVWHFSTPTVDLKYYLIHLFSHLGIITPTQNQVSVDHNNTGRPSLNSINHETPNIACCPRRSTIHYSIWWK